MGVLYEHWRTDLNECFYVGVSWADEDNRPYDMEKRHPDHIAMQKEILEKGFAVEVRIQAKADWLTREVLCEIEPLQIKYWKDLIGDRLVNIAKGGEGVHVDWTEERRKRQSETIKEARSKPEVRELASKIMTELWQTAEYREKVLPALTKAVSTQEYKQKQREISLRVWSDPELIERQRLMATEVWSDESLIEEQRQKSLSMWANEESRQRILQRMNDQEVVANNSAKVTAKWQEPEYRHKMMLHAWWMSNVQTRNYWGA